MRPAGTRIILSALLVITLLPVIACTRETETTTPTETTSETTTGTTTGTTTPTETTTSTMPPQTVIDEILVVTQSPVVGTKLELALREPVNAEMIAATYNPYDYSEITAAMTFTSPSGATYTQNAFWFKEYDEIAIFGQVTDADGYFTAGTETVRWLSGGINHFRVRITPDAAGEWNYTLTVTIFGAIVQATQGTFLVAETADPDDGFISVDAANDRNFIFASGRSYIPIGMNLGWWSTSLGSHDYDNWFLSLENNAGNYGRIWLSNWSFSLHKNSIDNFETRQSIAIRLDHVFDAAEEHGVYVMLTLLNHGQFSANTNPEWAENMYNSANGGMCDIPLQFFTNAEAKATYKNELLYIIARYGYSENIFAWELFNEVDWIDGYSMGSMYVTSWHNEMSTFLKANDPFGHLVTTSYKYTTGTPAYALENIDFVAVHSYAYGDVDFYAKLISETTSLSARYGKPVIFGEIGIDWESGQSTYSSDFTGVTILQAAWGGMLSGGAGSANHWWWDSWVEAHDLWYLFKGAGTYAKRMDLAGETYSLLASSSSVFISSPDVGIMGYALENRVYGYLYDEDWAYWNRTPEPITGVTVMVPIANGQYTLTLFDTITGEVVSAELVTVTENNYRFVNLTVDKNLAFILE